jgi:lysophospholipid acyltransferase (LPLAT)-like uncharacterized protein
MGTAAVSAVHDGFVRQRTVSAMPLKLKLLATPDFVSWALISLVRIWFGTVRVEIRNRDRFERYALDPSSGSIVAGVWHRNAIFLVYFFRMLGPRAVMVSRSKDGDLAARAVRRLGYITIRGSSSRGGTQALRQMISWMKATHEKRLCGTPVDGPRGPARVVKKGMLAVAKEAGVLFVPIACSGTRVLTFRKAWDKTMIPLPFSKMVIEFGEPIRVPADADDAEMEMVRRRAEQTLNEMTDHLDRICGYVPPASDPQA